MPLTQAERAYAEFLYANQHADRDYLPKHAELAGRVGEIVREHLWAMSPGELAEVLEQDNALAATMQETPPAPPLVGRAEYATPTAADVAGVGPTSFGPPPGSPSPPSLLEQIDANFEKGLAIAQVIVPRPKLLAFIDRAIERLTAARAALG